MPKASVDPQTHEYQLATCPGAFVKLRTLSFHEMQQRQDVAARMYREESANDVRRGKVKQDDDAKVRAYFDVMNVAVTEFEFRNCVIDHNLFIDDAETQKIDFTKPMRTWMLDPKIGDEISELIDKLNQRSDEEVVAPLQRSPSSYSQTEPDEEESKQKLTTVEN
jgi:hypothetical protein